MAGARLPSTRAPGRTGSGPPKTPATREDDQQGCCCHQRHRGGQEPAVRETLNGKKALAAEALDPACRLVGLKSRVMNMPATRISATEVIGDYHELWRVEKSFGISRSDLKPARSFIAATR